MSQAHESGKSEGSIRVSLYYWLQALVMVLVSVILLFVFVGRLIRVDGPSMLPTLHSGDMMVVRSIGYTPRQGDVVIFTKPFREFNGAIVKRVIAVGGQTVHIDYEAGTVSVDGAVLDEPYVAELMNVPWYDDRPQVEVQVPEGQLFVMGDNRNGSNDSRDPYLGTVDQRQVLGQALMVLLPTQDFGVIQ